MDVVVAVVVVTEPSLSEDVADSVMIVVLDGIFPQVLD